MNLDTLTAITPLVYWPRAYSRAEMDAICAAQIDGCNAAMRYADCTTVIRAACFLTTIEVESNYLTRTEEIDARARPYWPYIGRTLGQITWRDAYGDFGAWATSKGLLQDPGLFVREPKRLAEPRWAWLGPAWYWVSHGINRFADHGGILAVSRAYNGGTSRAYETSFTPYGWGDRKRLYDKIIGYGNRILPSQGTTSTAPADDDLLAWCAANPDRFSAILRSVL